jgi:CubicO group peptidase (beta-lactamase class C family)
MKKTYLIITAFILLQINSNAQLEFFNYEQKQKISSQQPADVFTVNVDSLLLDSVFIAFRNSQLVPGVAAIISKDNEVIWSNNYGYKNLQLQLPVEDSTLFLMASVSKPIIATGVMQLWENGLIALDDNINDYMPSGFTVENPYFPGEIITVKMLMTHTSSLKDNWSIMDPLWDCGDSPVPLDSFLINYFTPGGTYYSLDNFHNEYHPGQSWDYSNSGASLLALAVEHISGKSFDEYTRDSIFTPLSMNSSSWFLDGLDTNKIATPYRGLPRVPMCHIGMAYYPISQLRTNKLELSNFLSAYLNGGTYNNNRILNSSTIQLMLSDQLGYATGFGGRQGLIWLTFPNYYNNVWGHVGDWTGTSTIMLCQPSEHWDVIFFANLSWDDLLDISEVPISLMTQYAHLYGNIYPLRPSVDKHYARINIDPVLFRTNFSNIYHHQFTPHLIFVNTDSTQVDSLTLFDDGLHGDSLSNDGIYGNHIPPQQIENIYSIGVSTIDNQTNKYLLTPDICSFTTAGPVKLDSLKYSKGITNYYNIRPFVRNDGTSFTITGAKIKLICDDPWVSAIGQSVMNLPAIAPGATVAGSTWASFNYIDSLFPGYFNIKTEIMVNGWTYWTDSMQVIVTGVEEGELHPLTYRLEQNYPNPFNPSTTIKYSIPNFSFVNLKVYDILGNEVATIVNEEKPAGSYEVNFEAKGLSSGIYFYKLQAGSFVETRKMILMK